MTENPVNTTVPKPMTETHTSSDISRSDESGIRTALAAMIQNPSVTRIMSLPSSRQLLPSDFVVGEEQSINFMTAGIDSAITFMKATMIPKGNAKSPKKKNLVKMGLLLEAWSTRS